MNILIVESENDQYFIEALAKKVSLENKVCKIDTFKHSSFDEQGKKLTTQIISALSDIDRKLSKIGIILDLDKSNQIERINLINKCLKQALNDCGYNEPSIFLSKINELISIPIDELLSIKVACFFTNIDGEGELETVLKAIKTKDSKFADCLYEGWLECLNKKGIKIVNQGESGDFNDKELLKLWVDFYKRFDTLKRKDRDEKNTDWRGIMTGITKKEDKLDCVRGEDIFDLQSEKLRELKSFLQLFD